MSVKPLTVVTKLGTWMPRRGVNMGLGDDGEQFIHEDCVTLADALRYAHELSVEMVRLEREAVKDLHQNHGAFYLETQADLVLKARLDELEQAVTNRYEVSLRGMQSRLEQLTNRVKELERIELV